MRIVITGASGFIGQHLIQYLLEQGEEVVGISETFLDIVDPKYTHVSTRVSPESVEFIADELKDHTYDLFMHIGWSDSAGPGRADLNIQTQNLKDADAAVSLAHRLGCAKFVGVGTVTENEFGQVGDKNSQYAPGFLYGVFKMTARELTRYKANALNLEHVWVRLGNTYYSKDETARFINVMLKKLVNDETLDLSSGEQNYDFVYLTDALKGLYLAAIHGKDTKFYYVGSGHPMILKDFVKEMKKISGSSSTLNFDPDNCVKSNIPVDEFFIEELSNDCGYRPEISFDEGINICLRELRTR